MFLTSNYRYILAIPMPYR